MFSGTDGTANGPAAYLADNTWTESGTGGVTWNTQPALSSGAFDNKGALTTNTWVEYDVTALVTGNGTYTFALVADSTDGANFSSREGSNPPQLVVTLGTGTPTAAATASPTSTPTASSTPSQTPTPTNTLAATNTPTATLTPTNSPAVTNTATFTPTASNTPVATSTPTATLAQTSNSYRYPVATNTPTATPAHLTRPIRRRRPIHRRHTRQLAQGLP